MQGVVEMQSLYFDKSRIADMPDRCRVVAISSLMRSLMAEAVALPIKYDLKGRSAAIMKLIGYEVGRLRELPPPYRYPRTRLWHAIASSSQHLPKLMQRSTTGPVHFI
jgi:hypothetical protein